MKREDIKALTREAGKTIKSEKDLSDFSQMLKKITVETALFYRL
jgi:putative transposase